MGSESIVEDPSQEKAKENLEEYFEVEYVLNPNLKTKIEKITSNLETINNTLEIMAERIDQNERALDAVSEYFNQKYDCDLERNTLRNKRDNKVY